MTRYAILGVEGPTDQAVVGRALKLLGFKSLGGEGSESKLDPFWKKFIPTYPKDRNLWKRMDMPSIYTSPESSIAVYCGEGSRLGKNLDLIIRNHSPYREDIAALGILADADDQVASDVAAGYQEALGELFPAFPKVAGEVVEGSPRLGVFVFPDNVRQGVVEHIVLQCGELVYQDHLGRAREFVAGFGLEERTQSHWAPFDEQKAILASVASLLKPGKTNTASLADNKWISEQTRHVPGLRALLRFLMRLLDLAIDEEESSARVSTA
ncbi:MAG TPA: DUF3226 domain-containing protein [Candidatus Nanopelagicales bacterium]|nr:DUF3226 domain-containing protein [Candidatus Nanopelagicales bacterium]